MIVLSNLFLGEDRTIRTVVIAASDHFWFLVERRSLVLKVSWCLVSVTGHPGRLFVLIDDDWLMQSLNGDLFCLDDFDEWFLHYRCYYFFFFFFFFFI